MSPPAHSRSELPSRRNFLRAMGLGAASMAVPAHLGAARRPAFKDTRPNIIVIISDEHNAGVLGCYGNDIARTPNLDALAARGVVMENAYCNSPLCAPSRLSFTAGKYVSRVGAWSNNCWLPSDDYPSLPRLLDAAGYTTVLCGKMHYDPTRRYGFTQEIGPLEGWQSNTYFFKTGTGKRRDPDDLRPRPGHSKRFNDFRASDTSPVFTFDTKVTEAAAQFLRQRRHSDGPFFMLAGYIAPHFPIIAPEPHWRNYAGRVPMPVIPEGHLEAQPLNYKHLRIGFNVEDAPDAIVRKGRELYYGLTQWLDERVGTLLDALMESDVADNTMVVYTSDHGEHMGAHGLWWKNSLYDDAAKVPLIVSWPERWTGGRHRAAACSLVDLGQTIADLAEVETPDDWNGDSLCPYLDNADAGWKDRAVSEYYAHNIASGYAMLRTGRFKYVYHVPPDEKHPAERELYDLEADPGEFINLAGRPEHKERVNTLHAALIEELGAHPDENEQRCRADYARGYARSDGQRRQRRSPTRKQQAKA